MEPTNDLKTSTPVIVRHKNRAKGPSAGESRVSQIGAALEGSDDMDAQDASLITGEWKPARHAQIVPHISSNSEPTALMMEDISMTEARE
jgi:hypothetical protein